MNKDTVPLSDLVAALRKEIDKMQENLKTSGDKPLLQIEGADIELTFVVENSVSADGGVEFKVLGFGFDAGASGSVKQIAQHKLVLRLSPFDDVPIPATF